MDAHPDEGLLHFTMPGMLHSLGNALFAIQGHGQSLSSETPDLEAEKAAILRGAEQAQGAVEILGHLTGRWPARPIQAGILLHRLGEVLRVPLREGGLRLELQHSSRQTPELVDACVLCRVLVATAQALLGVLPAGFRGRLGVDLAFQSPEYLDIRLQIRADRDTLPFPIHLDELVHDLAPQLRGAEISRDPGHPGLQLRFPTLSPPESSAQPPP